MHTLRSVPLDRLGTHRFSPFCLGAPGLRLAACVTILVVTPLVASARPASAHSTNSTLIRLNSLGAGTFATYGVVRSADGTLHLIYQTTRSGSGEVNGLATRSISASGAVGPETTALSGWGPSTPGLVELPGGRLEAVFGAVSASRVSDLWGITSSDGGKTWAVPVRVGSGAQDEVQAYGAAITAQSAGGKPIFTLNVSGGITVQQGLGLNSPSNSLVDSSDNFASDVDSASDAASGEVVASWDSSAKHGGDFLRAAAPQLGTTEAMPGQSKNELVIAGRDKGPGVFGAYTADGTHVRLFRYGGGTVAVGSVSGITPKAIAVATGIDGRVWVIWGDESGLALTRSNKADTKFEPIQQLDPNALTLYRLGGDGKLGPLDLLVEMIPGGNTNVPGTFYTRALPELSAATSVTTIKNQAKVVIEDKLNVVVTDAGDPVSGAKVTISGHTAKTSASGKATIEIPASPTSSVKATISAPTYQVLATTINI